MADLTLDSLLLRDALVELLLRNPRARVDLLGKGAEDVYLVDLAETRGRPDEVDDRPKRRCNGEA